MEASSPALDEQRKAHPELGELVDEMQAHAAKKLYHQLTQSLLTYLASPPFHHSKPTAAKDLSEFFASFIKPFESKLDKVRWVQILGIVSKPQSPDVALELLAPYEDAMAASRDAKYMWQALKAEKLVLAGKVDEAKDLLESLGTAIEFAYEVDALIQSTYHKTNALMWKTLGRHHEFYRSSILFMAFTKVADIPVQERAALAFEIALSGLVAEEEFDFGELLAEELLSSIDGTEYAWIKDLLLAYSEGKFAMYDAAIETHRAKIDAIPALKAVEASVLRPKMAALALMELSFSRAGPKEQRKLSFPELAQHCRVQPKEVEHLVMKAMSAKLIKGKIDEVLEVVVVTWVKPRILDTVRIDLMRQRIDTWALLTGNLLDKIEEQTPELLVA